MTCDRHSRLLRRSIFNTAGVLWVGERQSIAHKGVRAIDARIPQLDRNGSSAATTSVSAPRLSTDQCEHSSLRCFAAG